MKSITLRSRFKVHEGFERNYWFSAGGQCGDRNDLSHLKENICSHGMSLYLI